MVCLFKKLNSLPSWESALCVCLKKLHRPHALCIQASIQDVPNRASSPQMPHTVPAAQSKATPTHNHPLDLTGKWHCLPPSQTENSVGFHSKSRNYLGAHKIVGLLPGREMMPEGNGRGDMEGKSVGMEQMPHVAGMEGLTPFSTLFWREWDKEKERGEKHYSETSKLLWGKHLAATIQKQKGNYKLAPSKHEGQCDLTCEAILIRTSSSTQSPVTALYLQNQEIRLRKMQREPKSSHFQHLSFLICNWLWKVLLPLPHKSF